MSLSAGRAARGIEPLIRRLPFGITDCGMRLLYVSHSFPLPGDPLSNVGGMQRVATELFATLTERDDLELHALLLEASWRWTHLRMPFFMAKLLREIPRVVREQRIDAVLFSSMVTAALAPSLRKRFGDRHPVLAAIPVGRDVTLPFAPYQRFVPKVFDALDLVLPISQATGAECLARGLPTERMRVVPCGVDTGRFAAPADRAASRRVLLDALRREGHTLADDALLLCSVGRHQERKGFHWFVDEVMPRLPQRAVYLLAGGGPMTEKIRAAVVERGLQARVRLLGRVSEEVLRTLYQGADLFVMPNIPVDGDIEGFGVVMLEAGLAGLPVLAAELEGIRDVIRDGENGHLLPSRDAGAFASTIGRYLDDAGLLREASARAHRYTADAFSWRSVAEQHVKLLHSTLERHPSIRVAA
jgi:phosphatidyl-myo-inositol dimannoside synthase